MTTFLRGSRLTGLVVHPELHRQLLRKSRWLYANRSSDQTDLHMFVDDLVSRFLSATKQFLYSNGIRPTGKCYGVWIGNLHTVFFSSLQLKMQFDLKGDIHTFWPRADCRFDHMTMTPVEMVNSTGRLQVQMALFPAVMEKLPVDDRNEQVLCTASVILQ